MNGTGMHSLVLKETEGKILSIVIIIIAITLPAFSVVVCGGLGVARNHIHFGTFGGSKMNWAECFV